jgi:protein-tyrosine kinase
MNPGESNIPPILKKGEGDHVYSESFKILRSRFEQEITKRKYMMVGVTSAIAGEGKTLLCAELAYNLASSGRNKVLLVDLDLRKADLGKGMGIDPSPGFSEYLQGSADPNAIRKNSHIPGLYTIPAGKITESPAHMLAGERIRSFFLKVRGYFDIVLLDLPPILPVADTIAIRDVVDGFIMVYRAGFTPYPMFQQAVEELGAEQIIGVVLNGVLQKKETYYQKYYGEYYKK